MNPIDANHSQSFENASIFILFAKHKSTTGIAPRKILKNAIVTGPKAVSYTHLRAHET